MNLRKDFGLTPEKTYDIPCPKLHDKNKNNLKNKQHATQPNPLSHPRRGFWEHEI